MSTQTLILAKRAIHSVADASTVEIACDRGALWITLDNDPQDYVLEPGQHLSAGAHTRAMVYALQPAALRLTPHASASAAARPLATTVPRRPEVRQPRSLGGWPALKARLGV